MMLSFSMKFYVLFCLFFGVEGTLTPDDTVSLDCGSQQTFNCMVTGAAAVWTISELSGISTGITGTSGLGLANNNARINTTDSGGVTQSSTITITGFTTADNGGTIQCIDQNSLMTQGMVNISVGTPSCPNITAAVRSIDFTNATVTWQQPSNTPVTSTAVTYCPTSSPNCGNSVTCTSPCTISGLDPCMDYNITVIPNNNCGNATGCTANSKNVTSQEPPSCPINFSANRDGDFTSANVTYELATPPPVVSTTVTYCRTSLSSSSSPICGNMSCPPSNGSCTISGLDPCVEYNVSAIPNNKCDSATGCGSMVVPPKGSPSCPTMVGVTNSSRNESHDTSMCDVSLTWKQPTDTSPVASTTVTYCRTSSSPPNCGNMTCTSPCTIRGLLHSTEYNFKVIPSNNCGSATECTRNNATANLLGNCDIEKSRTSSTGVSRLVWLVLLILLLIPLLFYPIGVLIVQRCCYKDKSYCEVFWCCWCCGCCAKGKSGRNSTEPMKSPTGDDDAQDKTGQKEEKLTYAALEFSEQAGSTGEKKVRSHEEPVQYAAVDHA